MTVIKKIAFHFPTLLARNTAISDKPTDTKHISPKAYGTFSSCYSAKVYRILKIEKVQQIHSDNACSYWCENMENMCRSASFDPVSGCWANVFKPVCYCSVQSNETLV